MNPDSLLDIIRRLLALGASPNEHEARAAIAKAHELAIRYNLSLAAIGKEDVAAGQNSNDWGELPVWKGGAIAFHVRMAGFIAEEFFFVRTVVARRADNGRLSSQIFLFGRPENTAIASHVMLYLIRTFSRLWTESHLSKTRALRRAFTAGMAKGLFLRMHSERSTRDAATANAIVLANDELDARLKAANPKIKPNRPLKPLKSGLGQQTALNAGIQAGRDIKIHPAVAEATADPIGLLAGSPEP